MAVLARAVLAFEALVILLAIPVALRVDHRGTWAWLLLVGLAVLALVLAALVKRRGGMAAGWVFQAMVLLAGFAVPALAVIGALFVLLWVVAIFVARRGDLVRERRAQEIAAAEQRAAAADRADGGSAASR